MIAKSCCIRVARWGTKFINQNEDTSRLSIRSVEISISARDVCEIYVYKWVRRVIVRTKVEKIALNGAWITIHGVIYSNGIDRLFIEMFSLIVSKWKIWNIFFCGCRIYYKLFSSYNFYKILIFFIKFLHFVKCNPNHFKRNWKLN